MNSKFREGLSSWTGGNIKLVKNPANQNDFAVLMEAEKPNVSSVLKQTVFGPFEQGCAYHLSFRIWKLTPSPSNARLIATVSYLNGNGKIIRSTPLFILLPKTAWKWVPYFAIVPPSPENVHHASVVFYLPSGTVLVDNIKLSFRQI